jgi:ABC-type molybdate transport system substrate-binding protein
MAVIEGASANAERFARFIMSPDGQGILAKHGFAGPR